MIRIYKNTDININTDFIKYVWSDSYQSIFLYTDHGLVRIEHISGRVS